MQTKGSMGRSRQTLSSQATARCSTSLLGFSNPPARFISDKKSADFLELPLSEGGHHLVSVWRSGLWSQVWLLDLFRMEGGDKLFRISQTLFLFGENRRNGFQFFFYIKSSSQLDLVLQSEEGGDLSGFMPNGNNFWYPLSFIVCLGVSFLIIHSHFMPKRYIFTISCFQVNGRCWACPEKGVRSSTLPDLSLMLTSPSQSRSGELFFLFLSFILVSCNHTIFLQSFQILVKSKKSYL